jgi:cytoskeletal protein CcmA (bactofilin family)
MKIAVKRLVRDENGRAILLALILLGVGGLIIAPLLDYMGTGLVSGEVYERKTDELYAADAGVEDAVWKIQQGDAPVCPGNPTWSYNISDVNGKSVAVTITYVDGQTYCVVSTATGNSSSTTIESYIRIVYGGSSGGSSVFDYALTSLDGNVNLSGSSLIESDEVLGGDIHANGNIALSGSVTVDGDATATGTITTGGSSHINGTKTVGAEPLTTPVIDTEAYKAETLDINCGSYTHTSLTITTSQVFPSPVHVQQNLSISGTCTVTFNGAVCVDGNMNISGSTVVTFNGPVKVGGTLTTSGSGNVRFAGTCYVGGSLGISGSRDVYLGGTFYVCGTIAVTGSTSNFIGAENVFAEGNINISGSTRLDANEMPLVMSIHGSITVSGSGWTSAILYAPEGGISLSGSCKLFGCAVGESITGSGSSKVEYPTDLRERDDLPGAGAGGDGERTVSIVSWQIE